MTMAEHALHRAFCLCQAPELKALPRPRFDNGRRLYRCGHCSLHQLAPYPVATNTDCSIYSEPDYLDTIPEDEHHGYFRALYDGVLSALISSDSRILDFGAGTCDYHRFLRDLGYKQVHSLEINPHLAQAARSRFGLDTVVTQFEDLPDEPFDLIYANQVLEHIYNPLDLINGPIADRLAPGGYLVLTLPNFDSLNRAVLGHRWIGYSPAEHIWFFTANWFHREMARSARYSVSRTVVHSAINTTPDRFVPRSFVKRAYYRTVMRAFEAIGRGDQLIVVLRKRCAPD